MRSQEHQSPLLEHAFARCRILKGTADEEIDIPSRLAIPIPRPTRGVGVGMGAVWGLRGRGGAWKGGLGSEPLTVGRRNAYRARSDLPD